MKTAQAGFRFPVLGFTTDGDLWGFADLKMLTSCGPRTLKDRMQDGMELVDADGRRWVVRSVARLGRTGSWLMVLLTFNPQSRIEHELDEMGPLTLAEVKARIRARMAAHPEDWGEGPTEDEDRAESLKQLETARSIAAIYERLMPDTFEPY
jgi:hypothetical protein